MARIRTIKPEFWESETIAALSLPARLTFIACLNAADDEGLLRWNAAHVKAFAFPYDDDVLTEQVSEWMDELVNVGLVFPYKSAPKSGGKQASYGWIVSFHEHQRINRPSPSKYPPPSLQNTDVRRKYAERDGWICQITGQPIASASARHPGDKWSLSLDHIKPTSKGGTDYPSNIRATIQKANKGRGNREGVSEHEKESAADGVHDDVMEELSDAVNDSVNESRPEGKGEGNGCGEGGEGIRGSYEPPTPPTGSLSSSSSEPKLLQTDFPAFSQLPRSQAGGVQYPDAFEAFWKAYPRNPADTKKAAYDAWRKAIRSHGASVQTLQAGAKRYAADVQARGHDRPAHVATWVNRHGWEAEYRTGAANGQSTANGHDPDEPINQEREQWRARVKAHAERGMWIDQWGPPPDERGCKAPPDVLAEFGYGKTRRAAG